MPDAATTQKKSLLDLAREKFGELTPAEVVVCEKTEAGEDANMIPGKSVSLNDATPWIDRCMVRGVFVEWICTDHDTKNAIGFKGIKIFFVCVVGDVNLKYAKIDFPLYFVNCIFCDNVFMEKCSINEISFEGSRVGSIYLNYAHVSFSVYLGSNFKSNGIVSLQGASVGGNIECSGGEFRNRNSVAFLADGICVGGSMYFREKCKIIGEFRFVGAKVGGSIDCSAGKFINIHGNSVVGDRVSVGGDVRLDDEFLSVGTVRFLGSSISGDIVCECGQFINKGKTAFSCETAVVEGNIIFRKQFIVKGKVSFLSSVVKNSFCYSDSGGQEHSVINLASAKIGFLCDEAKSWPRQGNLILHGLVYENIAADCTVTLSERIDWLSRQKEMGIGGDSSSEEGFSAQPHEQLASVYLKNGHYNHARKILIDKNEQMKKIKARLRNRGRKSIDYSECLYDIFHEFLGYTVGYGYAPHRALLWIGLFISIGTLIFTAAFAFDLMTPAQQWPFSPSDREWKETYPGFNPLLYSIEAFLPVIDFGLEKYWTPNTQAGFPIHIVGDYIFSVGELVRLYLWIHIVFGWILITLFLGSISGFIRR